jgi:hypothetical protein
MGQVIDMDERRAAARVRALPLPHHRWTTEDDDAGHRLIDGAAACGAGPAADPAPSTAALCRGCFTSR